MATFGTRLKELRKDLHLSQEKFAKELGTYKATISRWEREDRTPKIDTVKQISITYRVSMDWLSGKIDNKHLSIIQMASIPELAHHVDGYIAIAQAAYEAGLSTEDTKQIKEAIEERKKSE